MRRTDGVDAVSLDMDAATYRRTGRVSNTEMSGRVMVRIGEVGAERSRWLLPLQKRALEDQEIRGPRP